MSKENQSTYEESVVYIKEDSFICCEDRPCRVLTIANSFVFGKHGIPMFRFTIQDLFNDEINQMLVRYQSNVTIPIVSFKEYQMIGIKVDTVELMDLEDYETKEMIINDSQKIVLQDAFDRSFQNDTNLIVKIISAMNQERIVHFKEENQNSTIKIKF